MSYILPNKPTEKVEGLLPKNSSPLHPQIIEGGYVLLPHISWTTYESLLNDKGDNSMPRLAYFDGQLEIRMPRPEHEYLHRLCALLVEAVLEVWQIEAEDFGSMTHKQGEGMKGFEPDTCFFVPSDETGTNALKPILAIETDIANLSVEKIPLYATWGYPEVWRFGITTENDVVTTIYVLEKGNIYTERESSDVMFPLTRPQLTAFLEARLKGEAKFVWLDRVRTWARTARPTP